MSKIRGPIVITPNGKLEGIRHSGYASFHGIPYAQAPVNGLRFALPVPASSWEGVRPATAFGPTPLQIEEAGLVPEPAIPGEDILNVSVYTPFPDPLAALPVMVWIHGGAYTGGSPASPWYDGRSFARDGIVTVVVSYRLGFAGFAAIPGAEANLGVHDWILALKWVQEHIAAFGGDPQRVTLAGQSAGAGAVLTLLGIPAATSLFRAAWAASPVLPVRTRAEAEETTRRLAKRLGVAATREGLSAVTEETILAEQMKAARPRGVSLSRLIEYSPFYSPVVDGELIVEPTLDALEHGSGRHVDLVVGSNDQEIMFPEKALPRWLDLVPDAVLLCATGLRGHQLRDYQSEQRLAGVSGAAATLDQEVTDRVFRRQVVRVARVRAQAMASTHLYRFSWPSPTKQGAIHCLDLPFFWDVLDRADVGPIAGGRPPQALANAIHGAAVKLVEGVGPDWPQWDDVHGRIAVLGKEDAPVSFSEHGYAGLGPLLG